MPSGIPARDTRTMWIIRFWNCDNRIVGYHRGETGMCYDKRDAKIYQFREDAVRDIAEMNNNPKTVQYFRPEIEVR